MCDTEREREKHNAKRGNSYGQPSKAHFFIETATLEKAEIIDICKKNSWRHGHTIKFDWLAISIWS